MGRRLIIVMEEKDSGANFSFKFVPTTTKEEQSPRMYYAVKFMQMLQRENGGSLDNFEAMEER